MHKQEKRHERQRNAHRAGVTNFYLSRAHAMQEPVAFVRVIFDISLTAAVILAF
jgi:hypothetical protein